MNPLTRGYEDITVVIHKQFKAENCIKILKDIKVNIKIKLIYEKKGIFT